MNRHLEALQAALSMAQNELAELIDDVEAADHDAAPFSAVLTLLESVVLLLDEATPEERPDGPSYSPWAV